MDQFYDKYFVFETPYTPNTKKARRELSKSVFVPTNTNEIRLFNYHSAYEIRDQAALLLAKNPLLPPKNAYSIATKMLTGLDEALYKTQLEKLFLQKQGSYKDAALLWENFNFLLTDLDFNELAKTFCKDHFLPHAMLLRALRYTQNSSLLAFREEQSGPCNLSMLEEPKAHFFAPPKTLKSATQKLHAFWDFQKKRAAFRRLHSPSTTLYYAKYSKDFINLHERHFFDYTTKNIQERIFGVSIWAELEMQSPALSQSQRITQGTLRVTVAKSYLDGHTQSIALLEFDYINCFYRDLATEQIHASDKKAIENILGEKMFQTLRERFYPLFGIDAMQEDAMEQLSREFTFDEGDRGALLHLREFAIESAFSQKILPELIKALYDLINFNSGSSFPLFSCVFDGDIILNETLFPLIKAPLCTLVSSELLDAKMQRLEEYEEYKQHYKSNPFHYYSKMSFDPLRPILVY